MLYNRILLIALIAWFGTQIAKTIIFWVVNRTFTPERFFGDGGMPSGHSAVVAAVATATAGSCLRYASYH